MIRKQKKEKISELSEVEIGKRIKKAMHIIYDYYRTSEIQKEHKGALDIVNAADYETFERNVIKNLEEIAGGSDMFWDTMETLSEVKINT